MRILFFCAGLLVCGNRLSAEIPFWRISWNGSVGYEANLLNRFSASLGYYGFTGTVQLTDKRPIDEIGAGNTAFSAGLYHNASNSRLLYGVITEYGLAARLKSPFGKSIFVESHRPSQAALSTAFSSLTKKPSLYGYIGTPLFKSPWGNVRAFVSTFFDPLFFMTLSGGLEVQRAKTTVRIEALHTGQQLEARRASTWFSTSPPLPERDFRLEAFNVLVNTPRFALSFDTALSDTFAYGRDLYFNAALRVGDRPWRFSLAVDGAGPRFVGRDGSATGSAFRTAVKGEWYGKQQALLRINSDFRAAQYGDSFERGSLYIYYHFPAAFPFFIKPSRVSLSLKRDASDINRIEDQYKLSVGLLWWKVISSFSLQYVSRAAAEAIPCPLPIPDIAQSMYSIGAGATVSYVYAGIQVKAGLQWIDYSAKEPTVDLSAAVSASFARWGKISFTVNGFEQIKSATLSWAVRLP
ncbi:MAG: hypothetical protein LBQ77_07250 [Treponema sp.]|jgi:hypothetical protein|nr:hypothetical protein [Treponema sp.]